MNPALGTARIKDAVRRVMRLRTLTYRDLAEHLDVSLATVKRILADEELSLSRLLAILDWLGLTLSELEAMTVREGEADETYTEEQELFLTADPRYFVYLGHLYDQQSPAQIAAMYGLGAKSTAKYLLRLEQHGLIRVSGKGKVAPAFRAPPRWISRGPLARAHYERLVTSFCGFFMARAKEKFRGEEGTEPIFSTVNCGPMSRRTYEEMRGELADVLRRYSDAAALEKKIEGEASLGKTVIMLCHSWIDPGMADAMTGELQHVFGTVTELS